MRNYGRLLLLALTLALAPILLQATAAARSEAPARTLETGCGKKVVFLVWPKGHPAIPRIAEFPEIRNPHIELYRGFSSGYDVTAAGAYIIGGKPPPGIPRAGTFIACINYGDPVNHGTVAKAKRDDHQRDGRQVHAAGIARHRRRVSGREASPTSMCTPAHYSLQQGTSRSRARALTVPSGRCTLIAPPRP